jgi:hypothetical protein
VSRTPVLTATFLRARARLGIEAASPRGIALARAISALASEPELPGPGDVVANIPPTRSALVRRVPGRNLWLWYRVDGDKLLLRHVSTEPPVPVDE